MAQIEPGRKSPRLGNSRRIRVRSASRESRDSSIRRLRSECIIYTQIRSAHRLLPSDSTFMSRTRPTLDTPLISPYPRGVEIHLNPDIQAKLARIAAERGSDAELLAREAIEHFVDYDDWFIREVDKGLAQIGRGRVLTHHEVGTRLEKLVAE